MGASARGDGRPADLVHRIIAILTLSLATGVLLTGASMAAPAGAAAAAGRATSLRPCDLYAAGGTPCAAAYSTTRALYAHFRGPLYALTRSSDGASRRIATLPNGYADTAAQDRFCHLTSCRITRVYDQTADHNDLTVSGPGGNGGGDTGVAAGRLPVTVSGRPAYGMYFNRGMGYRDNRTRGIALGAQPESMYMVASGTHANSGCCFDFGNAEGSAHDTGNGHMDALYFGSNCFYEWPQCNGRGPWVQADLENGLLMSNVGHSVVPTYTGSRLPFVTAMLENNGVDTFALRAGDAVGGPLATIWSGPLPSSPLDGNPPYAVVPSPNKRADTEIINPPLVGYRPMKKEGAIVLGTGGDDSNYGVGSFFEGAMTRGYASDVTEAAVQADVVLARYGPGH